MSMPPTAPRLKFIHTHPGRSPIPQRPPRHPATPSVRSRSLELLDQPQHLSRRLLQKPEPLPRPRSRSLDGLLDDDGPELLPVDEKSQLPPVQQIDNNSLVSQYVQTNTNFFPINSSKDNSCPLPVPRLRPRVLKTDINDLKTSVKEVELHDDKSGVVNCGDKTTTLQNQNDSGDSLTDDKNNQETLNDEKHTMSKAKSCGAGLDDNESNEFTTKVNAQGSLQSLHTELEQKRKGNFMNKCVNKMRSLIKK